jgi:hypothetical protein
MTRQALIEQILRQVYGTQPSDDASITPGLVNQMINQGIGLMVKQNYKEAIQLDGVGYVNNSFYLTYKGLAVSLDEQFIWKVNLPQIPIAIGKNEGISTLQFKSTEGEISKPVVWLSQDQVTYFQSLQQPTGKILAYQQGDHVYVYSTLILNQYTATITIVSGGDSTNLSSTLNIPDDYIPGIVDYVVKSLSQARLQIQDAANDGSDAIRTA